MKKMDGIQILFELIIELCKLIIDNNIAPASPRPLSPEMRQELVTFISKTQEQISALEKDRQSIYNRNRHKKSETLNAEARDITAKIKPLRKELSTARAILEKIPRFEKLLETERQMEAAITMKRKERRYER